MGSPRTSILALASLATALALGDCTKRAVSTAPTADITSAPGANGTPTTLRAARNQAQFGRGTVDPASVGLPVYPGATESDTSVSLNASSKSGRSKMVTLATPDSFDRVYAYYKANMPAGSERAKVSSAGVQIATFQIGNSRSKEAKSVVIQAAGTKVLIQLVHAQRT